MMRVNQQLFNPPLKLPLRPSLDPSRLCGNSQSAAFSAMSETPEENKNKQTVELLRHDPCFESILGGGER